ncbi:MAG: hypothetical protein K6B43_07670 [Treponema sp.]|nr:hypothetical protein [Treponema sp.]
MEKEKRGGAREGAGRHKITDGSQKSVQIAFRVSKEQKELILQKAKAENLSLSEYLLKVATR